MAETAGRSSALGVEPSGYAGQQRGAAAAGLDDQRRLDGAAAALGREHGGVARPAAGDHEPGVGPGHGVDVGDQRVTSRVDRSIAPRHTAAGAAAGRRTRERSSECSSSSSTGASPGAMASAPALSSSRPDSPVPRSLEHLAQGEARPQSRQQRLAPFGHVPADGHAGLRRCAGAPAASSGGATRTIASAVPHESSIVAGRDHAHPEAGDDVVVAGDGEHGARPCRAARRRRCARRRCRRGRARASRSAGRSAHASASA